MQGNKTREPKIPKNAPAYTQEHYLGALAQARAFHEYTVERFNQIKALTPQWPMHVYEEVSPYEVSPPDPLLQSILDLSTEIGNFNLRLDALYHALNGPVVE